MGPEDLLQQHHAGQLVGQRHRPERQAHVGLQVESLGSADDEADVARVDHEVDEAEVPGVVVSRVNLSPRFMRELIDAMEDNFSKWQTREGIRDLPEFGPGEGPGGSSDQT